MVFGSMYDENGTVYTGGQLIKIWLDTLAGSNLNSLRLCFLWTNYLPDLFLNNYFFCYLATTIRVQCPVAAED
jgi:hypothetical protein